MTIREVVVIAGANGNGDKRFASCGADPATCGWLQAASEAVSEGVCGDPQTGHHAVLCGQLGLLRASVEEID